MSDSRQPSFPSEAAQLRERLRAERHLTPGERIYAVADALRVAESLSLAGQVRAAQLEYHRRQKEEWRRLMREFIDQHVGCKSHNP